jgi:hypothetical protein
MIRIPDPDRADQCGSGSESQLRLFHHRGLFLFFLCFQFSIFSTLRRSEKYTSNRLWVLKNVFQLNQLITFIAI